MIKTDMNTEEKVDIADKLDIAGVAGQADAADTVDIGDIINDVILDIKTLCVVCKSDAQRVKKSPSTPLLAKSTFNLFI